MITDIISKAIGNGIDSLSDSEYKEYESAMNSLEKTGSTKIRNIIKKAVSNGIDSLTDAEYNSYTSGKEVFGKLSSGEGLHGAAKSMGITGEIKGKEVPKFGGIPQVWRDAIKQAAQDKYPDDPKSAAAAESAAIAAASKPENWQHWDLPESWKKDWYRPVAEEGNPYASMVLNRAERRLFNRERGNQVSNRSIGQKVFPIGSSYENPIAKAAGGALDVVTMPARAIAGGVNAALTPEGDFMGSFGSRPEEQSGLEQAAGFATPFGGTQIARGLGRVGLGIERGLGFKGSSLARRLANEPSAMEKLSTTTTMPNWKQDVGKNMLWGVAEGIGNEVPYATAIAGMRGGTYTDPSQGINQEVIPAIAGGSIVGGIGGLGRGWVEGMEDYVNPQRLSLMKGDPTHIDYLTENVKKPVINALESDIKPVMAKNVYDKDANISEVFGSNPIITSRINEYNTKPGVMGPVNEQYNKLLDIVKSDITAKSKAGPVKLSDLRSARQDVDAYVSNWDVSNTPPGLQQAAKDLRTDLNTMINDKVNGNDRVNQIMEMANRLTASGDPRAIEVSKRAREAMSNASTPYSEVMEKLSDVIRIADELGLNKTGKQAYEQSKRNARFINDDLNRSSYEVQMLGESGLKGKLDDLAKDVETNPDLYKSSPEAIAKATKALETYVNAISDRSKQAAARSALAKMMRAATAGRGITKADIAQVIGASAGRMVGYDIGSNDGNSASISDVFKR